MKTNVTNMKLINKEDSNCMAHCSVIIEDAIAINDIWVMDGKKGVFVSFPQRPYMDGEETKYTNIVAPITKEAREELTLAILKAYDEAVAAQETAEE